MDRVHRDPVMGMMLGKSVSKIDGVKLGILEEGKKRKE